MAKDSHRRKIARLEAELESAKTVEAKGKADRGAELDELQRKLNKARETIKERDSDIAALQDQMAGAMDEAKAEAATLRADLEYANSQLHTSRTG